MIFLLCIFLSQTVVSFCEELNTYNLDLSFRFGVVMMEKEDTYKYSDTLGQLVDYENSFTNSKIGFGISRNNFIITPQIGILSESIDSKEIYAEESSTLYSLSYGCRMSYLFDPLGVIIDATQYQGTYFKNFDIGFGLSFYDIYVIVSLPRPNGFSMDFGYRFWFHKWSNFIDFFDSY